MNEAGTAFTLLHDVAVPSDPVLVQWCPTMDVCAVASQDGQLRLHRMNWQLLWSVVPEADVSALCWHPSGKVLAAGLRNGVFVLLDVETGHIQARHKAHFAAVAQIYWAECFQPGTSPSSPAAQPSSTPAASYTRFFHPPDPAAAHSATTAAIPGPYPSPAAHHHSSATWPAEAAALDLLVVADVRGTLTLWAQGQLQVAEVSLAGLFPEVTTTSIQGVMVTSSLDQLLVVHGTPQDGLQLSSCSLQLLRQHRSMLQHCSARLGLVAQLVSDALAGLTSLAKDWGGHMAEARQRLQQQLVTDLEAQGSTLTDASGEFLLLLAAGCVTPVMHQYLSSSLGEAGLRRLARGIDTGAGRLHAFLLDQLLPRLRLTTYVLAELRGAAATPSAALPELNLPAALFRQLELLAVVLQLRTEQLRLGVVQVAGQYRAFFGWLLGVLRAVEASSSDAGGAGGVSGRAAGEVGSLERLQDVTAFLRGQFLRDGVGAQLQKEELGGEALAAAEAFLFPGTSAAAAQELLRVVCPPDLTPRRDQGDDLLTKPLLAPKGGGSSLLAAAAALAGGGGVEELAGAPSWRLSTPLLALLQEMSSRCGEALEQPCAAISPAITAVGSWVLVAGGEAAADTVTSSSSHSSSSLGRVTVAPPISQPVQKQDSTCSICCRRQQEVGGPIELLLVRSTGQGLDDRGGLVWECCAVQVPGEVQLVDVAWYKEQQLALLVQGPAGDMEGASNSSNARSCVLQLVDVSEAPWHHQQQQQRQPGGEGAAGGGVLSGCAAVELQQLPCRARALAGGRGGQAPLGVSRTRGLALVVSDMQHVGVWDLEEDEEDEEGEEEEEEAAEDMEA